MGRSHGAGYPINFKCTEAAKIVYHDWAREQRERAEHKVSLTGLTRPTKRNGKGHPRKSWTTRQWLCSCGATGWSSHMDLERMERRG